MSSGDHVVLPIWLDVNADDVRQYSPLLADRFALRAGDGLSSAADKLEARIRRDPPEMPRAPAQVASVAAAGEARALDPMPLRGRIYPHMWSPVIRSDERALIARVALAARAPAAPEPIFRSVEQKAFEDTVAASQLESLMLELTTHLRRARAEHFWRRVDPTRSWVVTLARPPVRLASWPKWSAHAQAVISLRPGAGASATDWLILCLDAVVRPTEDGAADEGTPLSLDDLYALLYVPLAALLDEIAPQVLPPVIRQPTPEILAVGCLLIPNGDAVSNYVPLEWHARDRASGATDASGIEWYATSLDEVETPQRRAETIRQRIETLFIDGGYSEYEAAIERLAPPQLPSPSPT